jgi:hypothetical protein
MFSKNIENFWDRLLVYFAVISAAMTSLVNF